MNENEIVLDALLKSTDSNRDNADRRCYFTFCNRNNITEEIGKGIILFPFSQNDKNNILSFMKNELGELSQLYVNCPNNLIDSEIYLVCAIGRKHANEVDLLKSNTNLDRQQELMGIKK